MKWGWSLSLGLLQVSNIFLASILSFWWEKLSLSLGRDFPSSLVRLISVVVRLLGEEGYDGSPSLLYSLPPISPFSVFRAFSLSSTHTQYLPIPSSTAALRSSACHLPSSPISTALLASSTLELAWFLD